METLYLVRSVSLHAWSEYTKTYDLAKISKARTVAVSSKFKDAKKWVDKIKELDKKKAYFISKLNIL